MKTLDNILQNVDIETIIGKKEDITINKIAFDSRKVESNTLFVAIKGTLSDGHSYIDKAIEKGAVAVVCEQMPQLLNQKVTYIKVIDSNKTLAQLASNYYNHPSSKLKLVGVTGTNGKTTVATLLYKMFMQLGHKTGLISTVKVMVGNEEYPTTHTTPDSITINQYLDEMVQKGCSYCFMEVSSHGIAQKRTYDLQFEGGIFTNLSHDHLDYHHTFAEYRDVKKEFFDSLSVHSFAITNNDDKNGPFMLQNTKARKYSYAMKTVADFNAKIMENQFSGMLLQINGKEVWVQLIGAFNASNLLAVYVAALSLGVSEQEALLQLSTLQSVSGRFQFTMSKNKVTAIVDYAHTPDALENVLKTIDDIRTHNEQLITVLGCGGNRDRTKRPKMAKIASEMSNQVIFTSDNPRDENPAEILKEMEIGVEPHHYHKTITIEDRRQAIKTAVKMSKQGDIILIAGKGHETYQEVKGVRHHFDDLEEVKAFFEMFE